MFQILSKRRIVLSGVFAIISVVLFARYMARNNETQRINSTRFLVNFLQFRLDDYESYEGRIEPAEWSHIRQIMNSSERSISDHDSSYQWRLRQGGDSWGRSLQFRRDKCGRLLVYGVGSNGLDEHGAGDDIVP